MAITQARYTSSDEYRMQWVEDGVTKELKGFDHPDRARILQAIPNPTPHVKPVFNRPEIKQRAIVEEFWKRVAAHFGVSVARAKTHIMVMGAPQAVKDLWAKAQALDDGVDINITTIEDDGSWT